MSDTSSHRSYHLLFDMAVNLERFKKDLDRLIDQGEMLHLAMQKEAFGEKAVAEALRKAKVQRRRTRLSA